MRLRNILMSFSEWRFWQANPDLQIILEVPVHSLVLSQLGPLTEGHWCDAPNSKYGYRVEAENPALRQLRHVHVAQKKHTSTKAKQVSWNDTGTRHDKKSFNTSFKGLEKAKEIARTALNLPPTFHLEQYVPDAKLLLESHVPSGPHVIHLRAHE